MSHTATTKNTAGGPFTGLGPLLRFRLRLDRVRLPIWVLAISLGVWASVVSLDEAFPTTESLQARAELLRNPATVLMTGPAFSLEHYTFGAMVANELYLYVLITAALMSILLMVRHTRSEEESGRLELLHALPVGRFAPATAAILIVTLANLLVGVGAAVGLIAAEMDAVDSLAFGLGTALTGMAFASVTLVIAQLSEHARTVAGVSAAILVAAFLVRGVGDVINSQGSWLSWLSPFAWAQQTRVYVDLRWWPLAISLALAVLGLALAFQLAHRRDLGAGLVASQPGRPSASGWLLAPWGLADRLLRSTAALTTLGTMFFGVAMGSLASYLDDFLAETPALAEWIALEGTDLTGEFAGIILSFVMIAPIILVVAGVLRLKTEEESGRLEELLIAGRSRPGFLAGWLSVVAVHTIVSSVLVGISVAVGVGIGTGEPDRMGDLLVATVLYLPAILVIGSFAFALYGALPRASSAAWLLVTWIVVVLFIGHLLRLPDWAMEISPLTHVPNYPVESAELLPLVIFGALTVLLVGLGLVSFRRRDIGA